MSVFSKHTEVKDHRGRWVTAHIPAPSYSFTARAIRDDPAASDWLKKALEASLRRDPVDAVNDVEALLDVLKERLQALRDFHA